MVASIASPYEISQPAAGSAARIPKPLSHRRVDQGQVFPASAEMKAGAQRSTYIRLAGSRANTTIKN